MTLGHDIRQISRTRDVQISHNITFDNMLLTPETLQGLKSSGFYKPSPIQLHGIPLGKCGFDLLLEAKSGTGKTAVFTLIALEKIDLRKELQVVILAPTREIAAQICEVIKQIGSGYEGLAVEVVMGGLPVQEDIEKFQKNVHIVVASPGRLRHLIQDKHIDASSVRLLVLDEADKLMEKSFQEDIKHIFSFLPTQKQVIMSSATYTETAKSFIKNYVQNAQHVCPNSNCVLLGVDQKISLVKYNINIVKQTQNRFLEVLKFFSKMQFKQCLIFCNYQVRVSELHKLLLRAKWPAEQLYGNQEQTDRLDALKTLQEYKCRILIATDLAARGIDASNIDLVINFEPPHEWQTYLHRIGRAGRYGSYGMAITILSEGVEAKKFHSMLDPMKATINITNLWCDDDDKLNFSNTISPKIHSPKTGESFEVLQANQIEINKDFKQLGMLASNKDTKHEYTLEKFENLCASFDKSNLHIETFDELLQSFENDQHSNDVDSNFKHINMIKKWQGENNNISEICSAKPERMNMHQTEKEQKMNSYESNKHNDKILKSAVNGHLIQRLQNNKCIIDAIRKPIVGIKNSTEKNVSTPNTQQALLDKEKINADYSGECNDITLRRAENGFGKKVESNECRIDSTDTISKCNFSIRNPTEKNHNEHDTRKALQDAGLPTEFGKSNKNKNSQFHVNQSRPKKISPENRNVRSYPYDSLKIQSNNSCGSIISNDIKKIKSSKYQRNTNSFDSNNNQKQKIKCSGSTKYNKASSSNNVSENYASWYRNLKFQTKQIELAVYINELSKL